MKKTLLIHDIRSVHNVGSMFRTADAAGFDHIYISGYSPRPTDRFGRIRQDIHKAALGAEQSVSWSGHDDALELIREKKSQGVLIIGIEQDDTSVGLFDYDTLGDDTEVLVVMGNEVDGISQELLDACGVVIEIPMYGNKESLNVSVSFGIVAYALFHKK